MPSTAVGAALALDPRACGLFGAPSWEQQEDVQAAAPPRSSAGPSYGRPAVATAPTSPKSSSFSAPSPLRALLEKLATSPSKGLALRAFSDRISSAGKQQQQPAQLPPLPSPVAPPAVVPVRRRSLRSAVREVEGRWYREALVEAKSGDPEAMLRVAEMCEVGYGTPVDYDLADDWRELAQISAEKRIKREEQEEEESRRSFSATERASCEMPPAAPAAAADDAARSLARMSLAAEDSAPPSGVIVGGGRTGSMSSGGMTLSGVGGL